MPLLRPPHRHLRAGVLHLRLRVPRDPAEHDSDGVGVRRSHGALRLPDARPARRLPRVSA